MNEVMKALLERRSIRKFKPDALTMEQLGQIVEAGLYAAKTFASQGSRQSKQQIRLDLKRRRGTQWNELRYRHKSIAVTHPANI